MASQGETTYNQFIVKLHSKASSRFITGHDVQHMGRFLGGCWPKNSRNKLKKSTAAPLQASPTGCCLEEAESDDDDYAQDDQAYVIVIVFV